MVKSGVTDVNQLVECLADILIQDGFNPQETFLVMTLGRGRGGILSARNAAQHLSMHKADPTTKKYPTHNVRSAKLENSALENNPLQPPCFRLILDLRKKSKNKTPIRLRQ